MPEPDVFLEADVLLEAEADLLEERERFRGDRWRAWGSVAVSTAAVGFAFGAGSVVTVGFGGALFAFAAWLDFRSRRGLRRREARIRALRGGAGVLGLLMLVGCEEPPVPAPPAWVADTLASGRVEVTTAEPGWSEAEAWRLEPSVRIEVEGGRVVDVAVDAHGGILVLDARAAVVRIHGPDGRPVSTVGGRGTGPTHLAAPYALAVDGRGRVWVADAGVRRYATFERDGTWLGALPSPLSGGSHPGQMRLAGRRLFDVGPLVRRSEGPDRRPRIEGAGKGVVAFDLDEVLPPADTVVVPRPHAPALTRTLRSGRVSVRPPLAPRGVADVGPRGEIWVGSGEAYLLHRVGPGGDTLRTVVGPTRRLPLSPGDEGRLRGWLVDQSDEAADLDASILPATYPAFERIVAAEDGHLWVFRSTGASRGGAFDVFDPEGRFLGSVATDLDAGAEGVHPVVTGDRVVGVVMDARGRTSVVAYRIVKPPTPAQESP